MTISNSSRTAGPFIGNGITTDFPFSYKVFTRADVLVARTVVATSIETILTIDADYLVLLNADQNASPGGTIRLFTPLAIGSTLAATSNLSIIQPLDLTNGGGFYPKVINDALDRIVINIQQLAAKVGLGSLNVGASALFNLITSISSNTGSLLIGYILKAPGAVGRTVQDKLSDIVSTRDFGATGDPLENGTAFDVAATAKGVATKVPVRGATMFKVGGFGTKLWSESYGIKDPACTLTVSNVVAGEEPTTQIVGLARNSDIWKYDDRDHVAIIAYTRMRAATVTTAATAFTATSVTSPAFASAIAAGKIKFNMLIDTGETPKKTGFIQSVNSVTNTINVDAWYVSGVADTTGVPANGTIVKVNPMTKAWALNANIEIPPDSDSTAAAGFELGVVNSKADGVGYGYDSVSLGSFRAGTAFQCRAKWVEGFHAYPGTDFAFIAQDALKIGFYAAGGPVGVQVDAASIISFLAKNALNAFVVQDGAGNTKTVLDGGGRWQSLRLKYNVYATNDIIGADATVAVANGTPVNLPDPSVNAERTIFLKNLKSASGAVLFNGPMEDGGGAISVPAGTCVQVISDGQKWIPIGKFAY